MSGGAPTQNIGGTLLSDPGAARTLLFTLGTPTGSTLGATTVNTALEPLATVPTLHTPDDVLNVPWLTVDETYDNPAGNRSLSATSVAWL